MVSLEMKVVEEQYLLVVEEVALKVVEEYCHHHLAARLNNGLSSNPQQNCTSGSFH